MISLRDVVTGFGNRGPLAEVWRRSLRGGGGGAAEITGVPPLRYIGDGKPLTDYLISGNAVQDGTPSPDAPVDATGCGAWDEAQQSYKLPLTVNGTEYPIYLGQVETTRRIKKLVLTGEETWKASSSKIGSFYKNIAGDVVAGLSMCDRAVNASTLSDYAFGKIYVEKTSYSSRFLNVWLFNSGISIDDFKSYLAQQYAAGTPVTVWYVLAEPETAVVNEPLMKIGDYADTVSFAQSGVTIPTVNGENVLDVPTEVPPSEVTIKGGIRDV